MEVGWPSTLAMLYSWKKVPYLEPQVLATSFSLLIRAGFWRVVWHKANDGPGPPSAPFVNEQPTQQQQGERRDDCAVARGRCGVAELDPVFAGRQHHRAQQEVSDIDADLMPVYGRLPAGIDDLAQHQHGRGWSIGLDQQMVRFITQHARRALWRELAAGQDRQFIRPDFK